ncbi:MAG TPA: FkbM family methyltransferase [Verrucomicrobiae bacterium]
MKDLLSSLQGNFTLVNLGCIGDADLPLPPAFRRTLTVIEADAEGGSKTGGAYHKKISIDKPIAGQAGKRQFRHTNFPGTCSLLEADPQVVSAFGMEDYTKLLELIEFDCTTIPDLLQQNNLTTLDFLKTDIEGLDSEIIRSCHAYLGRTLMVQCELRFRPFYKGEPYFHETVSLLAAHGYEVLDLVQIDRWKYRTPHRRYQLEGRAQWADFVFVLQPEKLRENFGDQWPLAVAKQIILSVMLGKKNYAEYILEKFKADLPAEWVNQLAPLTRPRLPALSRLPTKLRWLFYPLELFMKHHIGKSEFVAIKR